MEYYCKFCGKEITHSGLTTPVLTRSIIPGWWHLETEDNNCFIKTPTATPLED